MRLSAVCFHCSNTANLFKKKKKKTISTQTTIAFFNFNELCKNSTNQHSTMV